MLQKRRLIAILMLVCILIVTLSTNTLGVEGTPQSVSSGNSITQVASMDESILNNAESRAYYADSKNKPGYSESLIAKIIISPAKALMNLFHLSDPVLMVFGKDPTSSSSDDFLKKGIYGSEGREGLVLGIFPQPFFNAISFIYSTFESLLPIPLSIALVIFAIIHMINSGTVQGRNKLKDYISAFAVAVFVLRFGHYLVYWFVSINNFLIDLIWATMMEHGVQAGFFMDMIWGAGHEGFEGAAKISSITMAILLLLSVIMVVVLNYQYTLRMIILGLLFMIFPITAVLSVFPGYRHSLTTWLKEFIANLILPLAHALALGGFFLTLSMPGIGTGISFWLLLTYFAGLPAMVGLIRQLMGLETGRGGLAMAGGMMGIAAISNIGRMVKGNKSGYQGVGAGDSDKEDSLGSSSGSVVSGSLSGATTALGKGAQTAFNATKGVLGNPLARGVAKVGLGTTAAMTGATLSTMMTGNPLPGAMVGTGIGLGVGKLAGKGANIVGGHASAIAQTVSSGSGLKDAGKSVMAHSMANDGVIANAGWGLLNAVNKVSSVTGHGEIFAAPSYFKGNRTMLNNANQGMEKLRPQMEIAQAQYNHAKTYFGADSVEAQPSKTHYADLKGKYGEYEADSLLARTRMKNYDELKKYAADFMAGSTGPKSSFSESRGRI